MVQLFYPPIIVDIPFPRRHWCCSRLPPCGVIRRTWSWYLSPRTNLGIRGNRGSTHYFNASKIPERPFFLSSNTPKLLHYFNYFIQSPLRNVIPSETVSQFFHRLATFQVYNVGGYFNRCQLKHSTVISTLLHLTLVNLFHSLLFAPTECVIGSFIHMKNFDGIN